jgi:hypothetical protein
MSSIERGERATTKPTIALEDVRIHVKRVGKETNSGVGFPNVCRRSPLTAFSGERYNFSKTSGEILRD